MREVNYRKIVEQSHCLMMVVKEGKITYINPFALSFFGYDQLLGFDQIITETSTVEFSEAVSRVLSSATDAQILTQAVKKGGRRTWVAWRISLLEDREVLCVGDEITEQVEVEKALTDSLEKLEAAKEAAERANEAKSVFMASMIHELKTPLTAVIGYAELMESVASKNSACSVMVPDLQRVRRAGQYLLSLVNEVLDLSKIEAGRATLYLETIELDEVIRDVTAIIEPIKGSNTLTVKAPPPEELGSIRSDITKVQQILFNLLSNAAKFTENGQITLEVERDQDFVTFKVSDTGIGMTSEQIDRIFAPFTQADPIVAKKYGGTGLGLYISLAFVKMMDGRLEVKSVYGEGSTFTVVLPAVIQSTVEEVQAPVLTSLKRNRRSLVPTVLVVEDDSSMRELMARLLKTEGYMVETCEKGGAVIDKVRAVRPDLITLDVIMPDVNGWSVLRTLKADPDLANIPVVVVTALNQQESAWALKANAFLTKPIDREELLKVLETYCPFQPVPARVLIIEDDQDTRALLRRTLEREGMYEVLEAADGSEGLDLIVQGALPDVIILDLMMPRLDGFEFLERVKQNKWDGFVVVVTAKKLTEQDRCTLDGVSHIFEKGKGSYETLHSILTHTLEGMQSVV